MIIIAHPKNLCSEVRSPPPYEDIFGYIIYIYGLSRHRREKDAKNLLYWSREQPVWLQKKKAVVYNTKLWKLLQWKTHIIRDRHRVHGDILLDILFKLISFKQNTSLASISINTTTTITPSNNLALLCLHWHNIYIYNTLVLIPSSYLRKPLFLATVVTRRGVNFYDPSVRRRRRRSLHLYTAVVGDWRWWSALVLFCIRTTRLLLSGSEIYSETHYLSDPLYHAFVRFSMCPERCFSHSDGSFQPPHFHPLNVLEVYPSSLKLLPPIPLATLLCLYIYIYIFIRYVHRRTRIRISQRA